MEKDKKGFYLSKLEEFRNGKYRNQKQHRTLITMGRRIQGEKEEKNIVDLLDNYVFTTKGDKTLPRMLVLDFYEFWVKTSANRSGLIKYQLITHCDDNLKSPNIFMNHIRSER